jgi:hypothetical protein
VFVENVDFSDLLKSWTEVCSALGQPYLLSAEDFSYTNRFRAYWPINFSLPLDFTAGYKSKNPNDCMDPGRTVRTYTAYGSQHVYPIGKTWRGDPQALVAGTSRPVLVDDDALTTEQQLRVHEAEALMGMVPGCTAGRGVTPRQRLHCIGNGWDLNVVTMFLRHSKMSRIKTPDNTFLSATSMSLTDVPILPNLSADDLQAQCYLLKQQRDLSPSDFASYLSQLDLQQQLYCLALLKTPPGGESDSWSVLDSGSSRHLHSTPIVTDSEDVKSLTGFEGSQGWTEGNWYLPVSLSDGSTGKEVKVDFDNIDKMTRIQSNILSMGKLMRAGWDFHLTNFGDECVAVGPGGGLHSSLPSWG